MTRHLFGWMLAATTFISAAFSLTASAGKPAAAAADHPLVGRFQGAEIVKHSSKVFDAYHLITRKVDRSGAVNAGQPVEGKLTQTVYENSIDRTTVEVVRAYEDALKAKGFELLYQCAGNECGGRNFNHASSGHRFDSGRFAENHADQRYLAARLSRPEGDVYTAIQAVRNTTSGGLSKNKIYTLVDVIEVKAREGKVEVIGADKMAADISRLGHVALYGIYFDTGKTDIKPESKPTLDEIAKLLKTNPALKLHVVGHTDNQGALAYNSDLSKRRADAVVQALTGEFRVAPTRLSGNGVAFLAPVAPNNSEEGRAKNRRVELVEQ